MLSIALLLLTALVGVLTIHTRRSLRRARADLDDEHQRLDAMFTDAPIGMAVVGREGRWLRVNPALCRLLGYSAEELEGRPFTQFTHPDDRDRSSRVYAAVRDEIGQRVEHEQRYLAADGTEVWALVTVSKITALQVDESLLVAQIQDISERKRAELALAAERHLLAAFLANTKDQVYFKDLQSRFIRVSNSQAERLGFEHPEALLGRTDFDVFSEEHARQAFADEQQIIRTGEPIFDLEERETFPDGREAWVNTTKLPLRSGTGAIIGTFGVSRDITQHKRAELALRESEERWRTLLAYSQDIVILLDDGARVTYASPSIARWLGYEPDELIGRKLDGLSQQADASLVADAFAYVEPECPISFSHQVSHKDGSWHTLESTFVCLRDDPSINAVMVSSRDVTEQLALEAERERLELERRVSQRLEAVGQLSAGIAHEINTPLQFVSDSVMFVRGALDELLGLIGVYRDLLHGEQMIDREARQRRALDAEDEADLEYLLERIPAAFERTVEGISRVTSIVQAMKRFSHPATTEMAPADLNESIETTLAVCRNEYKYVAEVELDLGELPLVTCNVGELNQVFLNLIINAAQAIEERRAGADQLGTIRVSTAIAGDEVVIQVADDGAGIPPELLDRIYEPFFTTKEIGRGSGQGLTLARTTIEQHEGALDCESRPGAGTTFTVRLPLHGAAKEVQQAA